MVSTIGACCVDLNTRRRFACEPRERTGKRAARENAEASHEREHTSKPRERTGKRVARKNAQASHEGERTSKPREGTRKYAAGENAQASHDRECASERDFFGHSLNKGLVRRVPCGLKIINLNLLVNSFPPDWAILCRCFRINTRLVCVFI